MTVFFSTLVKSAINNWWEKNEINISNIYKYFITCSKLIINELGRCPARADNVYFANNEQAFCFAHVEHNLIKLKLYIN